MRVVWRTHKFTEMGYLMGARVGGEGQVEVGV